MEDHFCRFRNQIFYKLSLYNTVTAVRSRESSATDTTKTFAGESSLTGAIIQTWVAATRILKESNGMLWQNDGFLHCILFAQEEKNMRKLFFSMIKTVSNFYSKLSCILS